MLTGDRIITVRHHLRAMKRFALILGIVLIAAILVAAGFWLGYVQHFLTGALSVNIIDKTVTDASIRAMVLHDLDSGHIDDARDFLRTELDGDIITIYSFRDYSDARNREMERKVLAKIADYRAKYPSIYTNRTSGNWAEIDAKIASILEEAKKGQSK